MRSKRLIKKELIKKCQSQMIEHLTGEENEHLLFMKMASIYVWISEDQFINGNKPTWKKLGTGILKLLKDKDDGKIRIVLRQKGILNVCANVRLDTERYPLEIKKYYDNHVFLTGSSTFFGAVNSPNLYINPPSIMRYGIKFKNEKILNEFFQSVKNHKKFIPLRRSKRIAMLERVNYKV